MAAITLYLSDFTDKRMTSTTAAWVTTSGANTDVPPPTSSEERWTWSAQKSSVCSLDPSTCPLPVAANCAMSARTWSPTPGSTSTYPPPRSKTRIPPHCDNWRHDEDNWMTSLPASCLHCVVCPTIVESSPKCHIFFLRFEILYESVCLCESFAFGRVQSADLFCFVMYCFVFYDVFVNSNFYNVLL